MQSFDEKLKALLKTESSFLDKDGELLEGKLQDSARNADEKLIKLLITDDEMRNKFFSEIAGYQVFNGNLFIEYISNKNFLDNSYTKYKNKIGLQINGKFLKENGDVELVRPFKDCVLEGGQTKEDEKKKEIFFNEILAQDEIDKLFAPKVLTNFKKYDKDGEHKVEGFKRDENGTIKDNLIIKGNNLLALHTLKKEFEGQVKCIYIDVPYNTGSDSFGYNDNFNHSSRLTFMKNRLEIAKKFLRKDGSIVIQVDYNEMAYLKVLCDEVLGDGYVSTVTVKTSSESGVKVNANKPIKTSEYLLIYCKDKNNFIYRHPRIKLEKYDENYKYYVEDIEKPYQERNITNFKDVCSRKLSIEKKRLTNEQLLEFQIKNSKNIFSVRDISDSLKKMIKDNNIDVNKIYEYTTSTNKKTLLYKNGEIVFVDKKIIEEDGIKYLSKMASDIRIDISRDGIANEGGVVLKNGKKPEALLYRILGALSDENELILDFFCGTGTTGAVAHKMGRQYIGIEQMDYGENDSVIRLNNVINGDQTGISKSINRQGGGEFIYCELKKYNQEFIEQIEKAKNTDELLNVRENMKEKAYFKYNFDMQKFEESIDEFKNEDLEKQKELLVEILNKNQLYVNLSDIDDENFEVSDEDKKLNDLFYE